MADMISPFMHTYSRLPVTFTKGKGAFLFDTAGRRYLDWTAGIAVNCLGHAYGPLVSAIRRQAGRYLHVCNYYDADVTTVFAEKLVAAAGMRSVFLGNSGAEANEGACKIARKYSLAKYGPGRHTIVTLQGSFHGRTITTLAATGQDALHRDFGPFTEGFAYVPGGDIDALDKALDRRTVAGLLIEAIRGEGGIVPQTEAFIEAAAAFCAERDILLMFDEIQCGLGRTGTFLACRGYGVEPDIVTMAKGLGGGIPVGAVLAGEKAADVLQPGDHGSTFGGNPLAAAAGIVVLDTVNQPAFLAGIARKGTKILDTVRSWNLPAVTEARGKGLMIGVDISGDAHEVMEEALKQGLLVLTAGKQTLRFLPPYIISDKEIDEGLRILRAILEKRNKD
ncbi:MAG: acetylornithine/succinylornithine family transaminase [Spirochaetaceae bacterium]|nr:acetylornithine/succinylornithine family transaminase [Spirochaetaceae bacterium]